MKRVYILSIVFLVLSLLVFTGCSCDAACQSRDGKFHGLCDNGCFSIPSIATNACYFSTCGICSPVEQTADYQTKSLSRDNISNCYFSQIKNSDCTGENGYVAVKANYTLDYGTKAYQVWVRYISYTLNIYDDGNLVGTSTFVHDAIEHATPTMFEDIFAVEVTGYYTGNYTFELVDICGEYVIP